MNMKKNMIVIIILAVLLAGCAPSQSSEAIQAQVNTAVEQTLSAESQIADSVALTVAAQVPLSTPTAEVVPPTATPITVPTFTPSVPTFTPVAIIPPSGGSSGGVVSKPEYACDAINRRPKDLTKLARGDSFDIKWTIVNKGTKTWKAGIDVKYFSGPKMTTVKIVEIPKQMKPNDTYLIVMDATAPQESGRQVMTWIVEGALCYPYVAITVK
jgi:type II secretory pathway pseudopilin PulG